MYSKLRAIHAGSLDDPSTFSPSVEDWMSRGHPWHTFHPDTLKFEEKPTPQAVRDRVLAYFAARQHSSVPQKLTGPAMKAPPHAAANDQQQPGDDVEREGAAAGTDGEDHLGHGVGGERRQDRDDRLLRLDPAVVHQRRHRYGGPCESAKPASNAATSTPASPNQSCAAAESRTTAEQGREAERRLQAEGVALVSSFLPRCRSAHSVKPPP